MSEYVFKLPDLGEGTVEAEIVEWHVEPGDDVLEEQIVADVMTDKANVEVPAPVSGRVVRISGEPGDMVAVGSPLIVIETDADAPVAPSAPVPEPAPEPLADADRVLQPEASASGPVSEGKPTVTDRIVGRALEPEPAPEAPEADLDDTASSAGAASASRIHRTKERVLASPAIRRRAVEVGIELSQVVGTGPKGRVLRADLDNHLASGGRTPAPTPPVADDRVIEEKVIGVRRVIAQRMVQSKTEIPHFAYVEEIDVTELEALRIHLSATSGRKLSILPFIATALIRVLPDFPHCNAHFDIERGVLRRFSAVHLGIAAQTPDGLKVPVVRNAQARSLWDLSDEIARVAEAARTGSASRDELSGSTVTVTSLGKLGGVVTTPVINYPEVAIVGVNKVIERPMVVDGVVVVRSMMNLSSSFDHRFVDGFDAAQMIQRIKQLLEHPATLFIPAPRA